MSTKTNKLTPTARVIQGALIAYLGPRMAMDTAIPALGTLLQDVSRANFVDKIPQVVARVRKATRTLLAEDADLQDLTELLDALEESDEIGEDADNEELAPVKKTDEEDPNTAADEDMDDAAMDARMKLGRDETPEEMKEREDKASAADAKMRLGRDETQEEMEKRQGADKMSRDRRIARDAKRSYDARMKLGRDETEEEMADRRKSEHAADKKMAKDARARMGKDEPPPFKGRPETGGTMTKDEIDKAIKTAQDSAIKGQREIRDAEKFVRPWVGELAMAFDSAEDVYRAALGAMRVKHEGIHESALRTVLEHMPKPGNQQTSSVRLATDAKPVATFADRYPSAARIGVA